MHQHRDLPSELTGSLCAPHHLCAEEELKTASKVASAPSITNFIDERTTLVAERYENETLICLHDLAREILMALCQDGSTQGIVF